MKICKQVQKGAAWLDQVRPNWWQEIDIAKLDLSDGCRCVLGQIAGNPQNDRGTWQTRDPDGKFSYAKEGYEVVTDFVMMVTGYADYQMRFRWASEHGFNAGDIIGMTYEELDEHWISAIKERVERGIID